MKNPRPTHGFTLIELMIVVAIVAILAAVAYPAYTEQVRKGRRAEARAALMNLLQQQERYLTQRNTYMEFATSDSNPAPFKNYLGTDRTKSSHVLGAQTCQAVGGTTPGLRDCIEVFTQPNSGYSDPGITLMAIDTMGRRRCTGTQTDRCWQ